ncbi:LamG-like jellyroll fold domain-containing protein [Nonomuraea sp. NPDC050404]|uniref:LamG-like jellyroll fold domain-containing protein n=1 Tax=Nonomuraea sp. NPDC050404 TaxID=3155783 RepID=UPI0033F22FB7
MSSALAGSSAHAVQQAPPATGQRIDTATEASAQRAARWLRERVEVGSMRTETRTVHATPEGGFVLEQHARPVRVRQNGRWTDVDTTLRRLPDGSVAPVATAVGLRFSGGGGKAPMAMVARGGKSLALSWVDELPAPVLDGPTATYREVLKGVDLKVSADVDGFSHVLVVKSRKAAARLGKLRFSIGSKGLKVGEGNGGGLRAVDEAGGEVFAAPTPLMWESPGDGGAAAIRAVGPGRGVPPGARHEAMGLEVTGGGKTLELMPDKEMLDDPGTRYPVYLDPSVSAPRGAWAAVWQRYPNTNYLNAADVARVGHESSTGQTNRSFFQLNNGNAIHGKQIVRATFRVYEDWSWSCSPRPVELWLTSAISNTTTWNNQPAWVAWLDTEHVAKGWGAGCPPGGVEFDATHAAVRAAAENWPHITLGMRATDERDTYAWKKFNSNPVLVIEYNSPPATPAAADVWTDPGGSCTTAAVVGTAAPRLYARLHDGDNAVRGRFEWYDGDTRVGEVLTASAGSGNAFYAAVPAGAYKDGSTIRWRVRAEDGIATGGWSPWCELRVDATAPEREPEVSSVRYPENAWGDGAGRAGSFTFGANGVTDVTAFVHGLNREPDTEVKAVDGRATVEITPQEEGPNVLSVRSKDGAGKLGPIRMYVFNVRAGTAPVGHWSFDEGHGGMAADSAGDHPATLSGAGWAEGRQGGAVRFDGEGQHAVTGSPIMASGQNLAVSAWVRLDRLPAGNAAAVAQDGELHAGLWLGYRAASRSWSFNLNHTAGTSQPVWAHSAQDTAKAGVWTHLTGVYDAAAKNMYLFVNGRLAAGPVKYHGGAGPAGPLRFGQAQFQGGMVDSWPGDVDDVRVWDRAVVPEEIAGLVNGAKTLTAHWKLDGNGEDATGRTGPLAPGGSAAWTSGWVGDAITLDGVAGHAAAGGAAVRTDQSYTVAAWVQLDRLPPSDAVVVAQGGSRASHFSMGYSSAGRWGIGVADADTDAPGAWAALSDAVAYPMEWTHIAGVYDAPAGKVRIYVGGQHVPSTDLDYVGTWNSEGPLQVGRGISAGAMGGHWPGAIDDVRVYQGALSSDDIARLAAG